MLVEQGTVHPLNESVGARRSDLGNPVLEVVQGQQQLVGMLIRLTAVLTTGADQDGFHFHAQTVQQILRTLSVAAAPV